MTRPRAVLFDLDGTLVDSLSELARATNATLSAFGHPEVPEAVIRTRVGQGARALVARSFGADDQLDAALDHFFIVYERLCAQSPAFPGVANLLDGLAEQGVLRGVATNKPSTFTRPVLEGAKLAERLDGWASADEAARKPDPASFALALRRCGAPDLDPNEMVYVGDMPVDVHAARNMGCKVIGVKWGFDPEGLAAAQPDAMADDAAHLAQLLEL